MLLMVSIILFISNKRYCIIDFYSVYLAEYFLDFKLLLGRRLELTYLKLPLKLTTR